MIIRDDNGASMEGITLWQAGGMMRVAVRGRDDAVEFVRALNGTWVSEDCEPVRIEFDPLHPPAAKLAEPFEADIQSEPRPATVLPPRVM